eukprot:387316-Amorphochlora_amoeboformis.AAC.1
MSSWSTRQAGGEQLGECQERWLPSGYSAEIQEDDGDYRRRESLDKYRNPHEARGIGWDTRHSTRSRSKESSSPLIVSIIYCVDTC